jgi:hypothetical protein
MTSRLDGRGPGPPLATTETGDDGTDWRRRAGELEAEVTRLRDSMMQHAGSPVSTVGLGGGASVGFR